MLWCKAVSSAAAIRNWHSKLEEKGYDWIRDHAEEPALV